MNTDSEQIASLVDRANDGDEQSCDRLLRWLEPVLRGFFVKRIGLRAEVDDLVQNTLVRVHQGMPRLRESGSLKAFSMKAALFELQDFYRGRYRPKERNLLDEIEPEDVRTRVQDAMSIDIEMALSALTPQARRIIELKEYGYKYSEIAEMVGSTEAAIKMQVKRAFERMRDLLAAISVLFIVLLFR
jgi:RNA polymerase sigma-70 factor (ECF subfamily)